ncbi:MAG: hypothetical protein M3209_14905 [Acidobacteriota bacterium]|nr:hypothetical protein [Acidobacteriota bacterium]
MTATDENLRQELLALRAEDERVREELAQTGELFEGYHPKMEAVHLKNAVRLEEMLAKYGWLGKSLVGEDGAEAAWLIIQHAISCPRLQKKALPILREKIEKGEAPAWQAAYLEDRILIFEGKPQIYGTQFDWDKQGKMSPLPIFEPEKIDERRISVNLSVPYSEVLEKHRQFAETSNEKPPANFDERQREFEEWAHKVGWRD